MRVRAVKQSRGQQVLPACRGGDEGGALVEFAAVLPILLVVFTGIFTFGVALNNYIVLTHAVNVAGRTLSMNRGNTTDPCSLASSAVIAASPNLKSVNLTFSFVLNGTTYSGASCNSSSTTTGAAGNLVAGAAAQVTVTYPANLWVYGFNFTPGGFLLKAQTSEVVQ
jgi:Flp pilus assembly protein TadG